MTNSTSLAQGLHGSGSREYDWRQSEPVLAAIRNASHGAPVTVEDLVAHTGVAGRTIRQILSDADGVHLLLGGGAGYFIAEFADDADSLTNALKSQIATMTARVERRDRYGLALPRRQGVLL